MDEKLEKAIVDIVGEDHYTRHIIDLVSYACDASEHSGRSGGRNCLDPMQFLHAPSGQRQTAKAEVQNL
ncbi:MAG: hypothetical protein K9N10_10890 [Deltaproteobacteria bacterium]|nr:hypothetical protein [Deltaproteobacteria bacterium]